MKQKKILLAGLCLLPLLSSCDATNDQTTEESQSTATSQAAALESLSQKAAEITIAGVENNGILEANENNTIEVAGKTEPNYIINLLVLQGEQKLDELIKADEAGNFSYSVADLAPNMDYKIIITNEIDIFNGEVTVRDNATPQITFTVIGNQDNIKNDYQAISLGTLGQTTAAGSSLAAVKEIFGEPSSATEKIVDGHSVNVLHWNAQSSKVAIALSVNFFADRAYEKKITGLHAAPTTATTLAAYNDIQTNTELTVAKAEELFGEPTGYAEIITAGQKEETLTWTKNITGDPAASFTVTFTEGTAVKKSQSGLK